MGVSDEEAYHIYRQLQVELHLVPLIDRDIPKYLKQLNSLVCVDIVTARTEGAMESLLREFNNLGISKKNHYKEIVFVPTHPNDSKAQLNYEFYLDDNPNLVKPILSNENKILLLFDQPWNKYITCGDRIRRIEKWVDVLPTVKELINSR